MDAVIVKAYDHFNQAIALIEESDISGAVEELKQGVEYFAHDGEMLNLLGLCYYCLCDFNEAYHCWSRSQALNKASKAEEYINKLNTKEFNDLIIDYNLALESINGEQIDKAIEMIKNIIVREPELIEPHVILGLCYMQKNSHSMALDCWHTARNMDKGNPKINNYILITQKIMLDKLNNKPSSRWVFKPLWVILFCMVLFLGYFSGKHDILEKSYFASNQKQPIQTSEKSETTVKKASPQIFHYVKSETELFNSAVNLYKDAEYSKAQEQFLTLIMYGTEEYLIAESIYFAASSYEKQSDYDHAVEYYQKYIHEYPNKNYYDDALYYCGTLLYQSGQKEAAEELLTKLKNEQPNSIYVNQKVDFMLRSIHRGGIE